MKPSNRWGIYHDKTDCVQYLWGVYTSKEDVLKYCRLGQDGRIVYIPKYAYHPIADGGLE